MSLIPSVHCHRRSSKHYLLVQTPRLIHIFTRSFHNRINSIGSQIQPTTTPSRYLTRPLAHTGGEVIHQCLSSLGGAPFWQLLFVRPVHEFAHDGLSFGREAIETAKHAISTGDPGQARSYRSRRTNGKPTYCACLGEMSVLCSVTLTPAAQIDVATGGQLNPENCLPLYPTT